MEASDSRVPSSVLVRVFFASNRMTYDFCHNRGHNCYKVRYSIQFDDISSMTFFRKAVHLNLVNPAKQDYCVLHAVSDEVAGLVTSLRDAADIDISEGQRESSLLHIILLREDTASTWEEALLRGNRAVFEPIIRGSAQTELTTNAAHSNKHSSQMIVLEQMEPNSLSSLSGESMESLDNDHLHSAQQSTEFEPACTPSIKLVDSTTLSSVLSGEDNLDKHRLPELDQQPPVKKFFSEAKMVSTLRSLANGSSFIQPQGLTSRSEEIPMKAKCGFHLDGDHEYHILSGGLDSMRTGEPSTMQTGPIDLERIERIIQSAEDLLRRRKATTEAEAKRGKDAGADGLQPPQMNAKHSPDSFYWLTDVDMDKLAVNYDASGGQ
uniref:CS domain-containing protein n=1 Tax=Parascaris univalens TaxID=6257 RepID=A0A915CDV1_PARUN